MSDVLVVLPSEIWGAIKLMVQQTGGRLSGVDVWGTGGGPSLQEFLNAGLSEMSYDEMGHIITAVKRVVLKTRCPNLRSPEHPCGMIPCRVCRRGEWAHKGATRITWKVIGIRPHKFNPETETKRRVGRKVNTK